MERYKLTEWDTLCWIKVAGGLNITDRYVWNKAALLKHLWELSKKKDKLWIISVHTLYIKGRRPWEMRANQASWIVRKPCKQECGWKKRACRLQKVWRQNNIVLKKCIRG